MMYVPDAVRTSSRSHTRRVALIKLANFFDDLGYTFSPITLGGEVGA